MQRFSAVNVSGRVSIVTREQIVGDFGPRRYFYRRNATVT
jgi:hypothetical protein